MQTDNTLHRIITDIQYAQLSPYAQWEIELIRLVEDKLSVCTSDAQSILEANEFIVAQCWGKSLTATETINLI